MRLTASLTRRLAPLAALTLVAAAGCKSTPTVPDKQPEAAAPAPAPAPTPAPAPATPEKTDDRATGQAAMDKALADLGDVSVYFEYDTSTLTKDSSGKLDQVAQVLQQFPALRVRIEGNCDERGSSAYNLALGQRRADAAKKYLTQLGAKAEQVTTISYGSEKPRETGHDESAWSKNRRDDLVLQK